MAGHSLVCCTSSQAVVLEVGCTRTQQQTSRKSAQLLDSLVGEAWPKCNGVSTRIFTAANCNSVIIVVFFTELKYSDVRNGAIKIFFDWRFVWKTGNCFYQFLIFTFKCIYWIYNVGAYQKTAVWTGIITVVFWIGEYVSILMIESWVIRVLRYGHRAYHLRLFINCDLICISVCNVLQTFIARSERWNFVLERTVEYFQW